MKLLTIKELSELTKVKVSTLYVWVSKGMIPSFKLNGLLRFDQKEIEEWIQNSKIKAVPISIPKPKHNRDVDIDAIVKRSIDSVKRQGYNTRKGKARPNQAQKGGCNGSI